MDNFGNDYNKENRDPFAPGNYQNGPVFNGGGYTDPNGFDPEKIAGYGEEKIEALLERHK